MFNATLEKTGTAETIWQEFWKLGDTYQRAGHCVMSRQPFEPPSREPLFGPRATSV